MTIATKLKALGAAALLAIGGTGVAQANSFAHSAQATEHSIAASGHASAGVASGVATVVAVPVLTIGSGMALSGHALAELGEGTAEAGHHIYMNANTPMEPIKLGPVADPAPRLD